MHAPLDYARAYLADGHQPIPVPYRSKKPIREGWQALILTAEQLPAAFDGAAQNVGLLNGAPSGGLQDIDLDAAEAVAVAPFLLPPTGMVSGRERRPRSHYWYVVDDPPAKASESFNDPTRPQGTPGWKLLEWRSTGSMTLVPPSVGPEGDRYVWHERGAPARVPVAALRRAVRHVAAAALLARAWPGRDSHVRHETALALAGWLLRGGLDADSVAAIIAAATTAAGDEEAGDRVRAARDTARRLAAAEPVTGGPTLAGLLPAAVVTALARWLGLTRASAAAATAPGGTSGPAPAPGPAAVRAARERPWPVLHPAALTGLAGAIVRRLDPVTEADPVAVLVRVLVTFGVLAGRTVFTTVEADRHHLNEFAVVVGETAKARKDSARGRVEALFAAAAETAALLDQVTCSGLSSGEGLIYAVRDPIERIERDKQTGRYEPVVVDAGASDKRLLVNESEFARVLKVLSRDGNTLAAVLRDAWDGRRTLRVMTRVNPLVATGAHVGIIANITRDELRRYLAESEIAGGSANRFLFVCARRSKLLPEGGGPVAGDDLARELAAALAWCWQQPRHLRRDEAARALWARVYPTLSAPVPGLLGAVTSRAEAHVLRLSCLYAALDRSETVQVPHLRAALAVWQYCADSAAYIFGDAIGDPVADQVLDALAHAPAGLTRTDLRDLFGRNLPAGRLDAALGVLLREGRATAERVASGGRPSEVWRAAVPPDHQRAALALDALGDGALALAAPDAPEAVAAPTGAGDDAGGRELFEL